MKQEYKFGDALFRLESITVRYDGREVLREVNATIYDVIRPGISQGQIVGILGPSGCGKSTLCRVMCGLEEPSNGAVRFGRCLSKRFWGTGPYQTHGQLTVAGAVGFVAQNYPLFRHRTVLQNLNLAARRGGRSDEAVRRDVGQLVETFKLGHVISLWPSQLSGGQRQRVAIAQQLLCAGKYLVLDEPFTGLDPVVKDKVCETIRKVSLLDEENTIFVVAHDIHTVASVADTIWLIGKEPNRKDEGATLVRAYDLMNLGFAWDPEAQKTPEFFGFINEIRAEFDRLV